MSDQARNDAEFLLSLPEFRRFLFAAIQTAGVLSQTSAAHGHDTRDFLEGRRSLGFDILMMAHAGQPDAIRQQDPDAIATLNAVLREALNPVPKEKNHEKRRNPKPDRYDDELSE